MSLPGTHPANCPSTHYPPLSGWTSVLDLLRRPERHEATTYPWVSIERVRAMADAVGLTITEELTYPMAETAQYHD